MPSAKVSPEIKAAALADLMSGEQPAVVAERYGLPSGTVRQWKNRLNVTGRVTEHAPAPVTLNVGSDDGITAHRPTIEQQQLRILELMYENLIAKLTASQRIANYAATTEWLSRQDAAGIAELGQYLDATAANLLALLAGRGGETPRD